MNPESQSTTYSLPPSPSQPPKLPQQHVYLEHVKSQDTPSLTIMVQIEEKPVEHLKFRSCLEYVLPEGIYHVNCWIHPKQKTSFIISVFDPGHPVYIQLYAHPNGYADVRFHNGTLLKKSLPVCSASKQSSAYSDRLKAAGFTAGIITVLCCCLFLGTKAAECFYPLVLEKETTPTVLTQTSTMMQSLFSNEYLQVNEIISKTNEFGQYEIGIRITNICDQSLHVNLYDMQMNHSSVPVVSTTQHLDLDPSQSDIKWYVLPSSIQEPSLIDSLQFSINALDMDNYVLFESDPILISQI